ncbi:MAG: EF-hand domain-containing protein [Pseudomonadota bacterium]
MPKLLDLSIAKEKARAKEKALQLVKARRKAQRPGLTPIHTGSDGVTKDAPEIKTPLPKNRALTTLKTTPVAALALVLVASFSAPASAQPFGLSRADLNGDGAVTRAEAIDARKKMFDRMDRNNDGQISQKEQERVKKRIAFLARFVENAVTFRADDMDVNNDGLVSEDEFMARIPMFDLADRNEDGVVTSEEIETVRAALGADQD